MPLGGGGKGNKISTAIELQCKCNAGSQEKKITELFIRQTRVKVCATKFEFQKTASRIYRVGDLGTAIANIDAALAVCFSLSVHLSATVQRWCLAV